MKEYKISIQFVSSFEERDQVYALLSAFREFLNSEVPVGNFEFQDIHLWYENTDDDVSYGKNH